MGAGAPNSQTLSHLFKPRRSLGFQYYARLRSLRKIIPTVKRAQNDFRVWVEDGLGVVAVTPMEWMLILGGLVIFGMQAVTVFHTTRTRSNMDDLVHGVANAMQHLSQRLEGIEKIPEILQDLNLGGVQLMPQKSLGEIVMEKIMERMSFGKNIDSHPPPEVWPDADQPENLPPVSDSEA